jgi:hypothetical protein
LYQLFKKFYLGVTLWKRSARLSQEQICWMLISLLFTDKPQFSCVCVELETSTKHVLDSPHDLMTLFMVVSQICLKSLYLHIWKYINCSRAFNNFFSVSNMILKQFLERITIIYGPSWSNNKPTRGQIIKQLYYLCDKCIVSVCLVWRWNTLNARCKLWNVISLFCKVFGKII